MKHILFIEDNIEYAKIIAKILRAEGYEVTVYNSAFDALAFFEKYTKIIDLVIADLDMAPISGIQIAELVYKQNPIVPVMILTGSIDDDDEKKALQHGVNEYVRKSVSFTVLLRRIEHTLAQSKVMKPRKTALTSKVENLSLDVANIVAVKDDNKIPLTALEFRLVKYFLLNKNRIVSREELLKNVWKYNIADDIDSRVVDTYIKNIRKKLGIKSIFTIRGVGYRWNE